MSSHQGAFLLVGGNFEEKGVVLEPGRFFGIWGQELLANQLLPVLLSECLAVANDLLPEQLVRGGLIVHLFPPRLPESVDHVVKSQLPNHTENVSKIFPDSLPVDSAAYFSQEYSVSANASILSLSNNFRKNIEYRLSVPNFNISCPKFTRRILLWNITRIL